MSAEPLFSSLHARTEGDGRTQTHALDCGTMNRCYSPCWGSCRCWCHGITTHLNGTRRADAP